VIKAKIGLADCAYVEYNKAPMLDFSPKVLEVLASPFSITLAFIFGAFLFWRSSRYELVGSQDIFDVTVLFTFGSLFLGRVGDFFVRSDFYNWSFARLFFFNVFSGFDWYLAFLGGAGAVWFYMKNRRENFWFVFDLAASPLIFSLSVYFVTNYIFGGFAPVKLLLIGLYYFVVFWVLKRLEMRKRHRGFFACFAILSVSLSNIVFAVFPISKLNLENIPYELIWGVLMFVFAIFCWYILAKRKVRDDLKSFFAGILLLVFKTKRVIFSIKEADGAAKFIVLSPFLLAKAVLFLVKLISRQVAGGLLDFAHALGVRR